MLRYNNINDYISCMREGKVGLANFKLINDELYKELYEYCLNYVKDDPVYSYIIGTLYDKGYYVEKDFKKALYYYELSAKENYGRAINTIGTIIDKSFYPGKEKKECIEYYKRAIELGFDIAYANIGEYYYYTEKDYLEAIYYYKLAEKNNVSSAYTNLALAYYNGNGVEKNIEKAVEYFKINAEKGYGYDLYKLGEIYQFDYNDQMEALFYYRQALDQEYFNAAHKLAKMYYDNKDYNKALQYYEIGKSKNNSDSINMIGIFYEYGYGVEKDYYKSFENYLLSANLNNEVAMYNVGLAYEFGRGIEKDYNKAFDWYTKSANLNYTRSYLRIGLLYRKGFETV